MAALRRLVAATFADITKRGANATTTGKRASNTTNAFVKYVTAGSCVVATGAGIAYYYYYSYAVDGWRLATASYVNARALLQLTLPSVSASDKVGCLHREPRTKIPRRRSVSLRNVNDQSGGAGGDGLLNIVIPFGDNYWNKIVPHRPAPIKELSAGFGAEREESSCLSVPTSRDRGVV
ncbi:hypothetical protein NHX12_011768 [Muraenolepis orangiensis]|uniref:Uncharacterized protein n=1 Tax=Muraenolepis orangiensis TaxID=630683 RepID=A0A9Q0I715_9TELE|nr:hypothetical protein NHX12_011768 [Muraenolepis orangiensis]